MFQTPPATAYRRVDQTASFGTLPRRNQPTALSTFNSAGVMSHQVDGSTKCNSLSSGNINTISSAAFGQNGGGNHFSLIYFDDKSHQHQYGGDGGMVVGKRNSVLSPRANLPQMMVGPLALQDVRAPPSQYYGKSSEVVGSRCTSVPDLGESTKPSRLLLFRKQL